MDLFDNQMVKSALKSLSAEDTEKYKKIGESMYNTINFTDGTILDDINPPIAESVGYIEQGLNSGLEPNDLEETEIQLMINTFGNEWYQKYGFDEGDKPDYQLTNGSIELASNEKNMKID
jgi:hypothetical protein